MNILIVEDEFFAAKRLEDLVRKTITVPSCIHFTTSVASTVAWLKGNPQPDLIFLDIQLGDGLSFEIFGQTNVNASIIFTTAFDQFAIKAFKLNSIDYLLKPIDEDELKHAVNKFFERQKISSSTSAPDFQLWQQMMDQLRRPSYKDRFTVRIGVKSRIVNQSDIICFFSSNKATYLRTIDGRDYLLDYSLEWIEEAIDPRQFFRINRKYIIALAYILEMIAESSSRIKLKITQQKEDDVIVARERVKEFKDWIEGHVL
ncbi:MAG: LytTR family DNA-binding domain-containing protein [Breznakibacter sp.]